jgi:hypothetical protein
MDDEKSEKEKGLNYTVQPFARQFFDTISSVQLLAANDSHVYFSAKYLCITDNVSAFYYAFSTP